MDSSEICARLENAAKNVERCRNLASLETLYGGEFLDIRDGITHIRAQDVEINTKADFIGATVNQLAIVEDRIKRLETALRGIAIEAERENGAWVHLKRVIGLNARAALEETHDRG